MKKRLHSKDDEAASIALDGEGGLSVLGKNGLSNGSTEYMLVRYSKKQLTIPPGDGAASPALAFTEQRGQLTDTSGTSVEGVRFYSTGSYPPLYVQNDTLSFVAASVDTSSATPDTLHRVDITFFDSKTSLMSAAGLDQLDNYRNYYLGHIPEGRARVGQYGRVAVTDLYDGINLQMFADESGIVYYFVIQPGGDPNDLKLDFHGQDSLYLKARNLFVGTSLGDFNLPAPKAFQIDSLGQEVSTAWKPEYSIAGSRVSFSSTGSYDSTKVLVVELRKPEVTSGSSQDEWVTFFGGIGTGDPFDLGDDLSSIFVDEDGSVFVTGFAGNIDFPLVDGGLIVDLSGESADGLVAKFNNQAVLQYLSVLGGSREDIARDIVGFNNKVVIVGETNSPDFPEDNVLPNLTSLDGFAASFNKENGMLGSVKVYGGTLRDRFLGVDKFEDRIFVVGNSGSTNFPTENLAGAYNQSSNNSAVGDSRDAVILELDEQTLELVWSTYFGGTNYDIASDIVVDQNTGSFYICGVTRTKTYHTSNCAVPGVGGGFPGCKPSGADQFSFNNGGGTVGEIEDTFIAEFDNNGAISWSTFFGGHSNDGVSIAGRNNLAFDPNSSRLAIIGSSEDCSTIPSTTSGGYQQDIGLGNYIAVFKDRSLQWSSGFGGFSPFGTFNQLYLGESCTFKDNGNLFITGFTNYLPQPSNDYCTAPSISSNEFPICPPQGSAQAYFQESGGIAINEGEGECYIASFDQGYNLVYSTFFGGNGADFIRTATMKSDDFYFVGQSESTVSFPWRFPSSPPNVYKQDELFGGLDGFIGRLRMNNLVSVDDYKRVVEDELIVFPNPNNGQFTITLPSREELNVPFRIIDSRGVTISVGMARRGELISINLPDIPAGAYYFVTPYHSAPFIKY
ncbi:DUF7948 domain-containing protein [Phaeodactylibacter xiamenensis]|uniref:DUF7948 domain-containing protein n=2 Tax=Phaeodactylibacter xiamenensis TaxID=1524460 RepID=A0A098RXP6_9BACT|nr:hypothetical protein [Phaeodactylibacter xiamenensis]KGE84959.1 hypothetical protein IX84_30530 [Phaeodactylibacter xiamenensis]